MRTHDPYLVQWRRATLEGTTPIRWQTASFSCAREHVGFIWTTKGHPTVGWMWRFIGSLSIEEGGGRNRLLLLPCHVSTRLLPWRVMGTDAWSRLSCQYAGHGHAHGQGEAEGGVPVMFGNPQCGTWPHYRLAAEHNVGHNVKVSRVNVGPSMRGIYGTSSIQYHKLRCCAVVYPRHKLSTLNWNTKPYVYTVLRTCQCYLWYLQYI